MRYLLLNPSPSPPPLIEKYVVLDTFLRRGAFFGWPSKWHEVEGSGRLTWLAKKAPKKASAEESAWYDDIHCRNEETVLHAARDVERQWKREVI